MESHGWDELDIIIVSGDAYVDHPAWGRCRAGSVTGGPRLSARYNRPAGLARSGGHHQPGTTAFVFRGIRRQPGQHGKPLHRRQKEAAGGYVLPRRAGWAAPGSSYHRLQQSDPSGIPGCAHRHRGVEASLRRLAHYDYWSDQVRRPSLVDSRA